VIAIMVDLGWWPWWGTTLVALGVAAAAATGVALTPRSFARGVLATIAVEGVVLAAVAPVVMHRGRSTPSMAGPQPAGAMSGRSERGQGR
jgi:hypothetical protein